jgi:predicted PurR-regulated permease PerM
MPEPSPDAPDTDSVPEPLPQQVLLHMPVDVRSASLAILAGLGSVFMLQWASPVIIPLMLGLTFSYALAPLVDRLERLRIPRALGAGLVIVAIAGTLAWMAYVLRDEASQFIESLPNAAQKVGQALRSKPKGEETALDKVQKAATQLERAAQEGGSAPTAPVRGVTRVQIERAQFSVKDYLWTSTPGMVASIGQATVVLFITFFLLAAGSTFRRKLVKLAGPNFTQKRITVQALDEITEQIQRYLLIQVIVSLIVALVTWLAFLLIGLEHAAVWGVLAFTLNFIPYIGAIALAGGAAFVGFVQFGNVDMAVLVAGVSMTIHLVSGNLLTPWLMSRTSRMNSVTIFVGVLAFGWLWGAWGLVLGVPTLMMVKAVCDRVDDLKPLGEMLGA